jgi:hypothetical protein
MPKKRNDRIVVHSPLIGAPEVIAAIHRVRRATVERTAPSSLDVAAASRAARNAATSILKRWGACRRDRADASAAQFVAECATSDIFERFDPAKGSKGWYLYGVIKNILKAHITTEAGRPRTWTRKALRDRADASKSPRLDLDTHDTFEQVLLLINFLSSEQRQVLLDDLRHAQPLNLNSRERRRRTMLRHRARKSIRDMARTRRWGCDEVS